MTSPATTTEKRSTALGGRVFTSVLLMSMLVWTLLAVVLIVGVAFLAEQLLRETIVVTVLSGLVAVVSLIPGLVQEWAPQPSRAAADGQAKQSYHGPIFGGIILRLVATVALFAMCRYQFAETMQVIAALTIGWYVILTMVEVGLLARKIPRLDSSGMMVPLIASSLANGTPQIA